jgi:Leucine Rich repeat
MSAKPAALGFRWFGLVRFSVRTMMIVALVTGACVGWMVRAARVQREAVQAILKCGGFVKYECEAHTTGGPRMRIWPMWWAKSVGLDYVSRVSEVTLGPNASDVEMVYVGHLDGLEELSAIGSQFTGASLRRTARMRSLRALALFGIKVSDCDLGHISGLSRLRSLWLTHLSISDAGLAALHGITDLEVLDLSDTRISGPGLINLRRMTQLRNLYLAETPIDDRGMIHLGGLKALVYLDLEGTAVTDAGLSPLKGLTKLRELRLTGTGVTDAGVEAFSRQLPGVRVVR